MFSVFFHFIIDQSTHDIQNKLLKYSRRCALSGNFKSLQNSSIPLHTISVVSMAECTVGIPQPAFFVVLYPTFCLNTFPLRLLVYQKLRIQHVSLIPLSFYVNCTQNRIHNLIRSYDFETNIVAIHLFKQMSHNYRFPATTLKSFNCDGQKIKKSLHFFHLLTCLLLSINLVQRGPPSLPITPLHLLQTWINYTVSYTRWTGN